MTNFQLTLLVATCALPYGYLLTHLMAKAYFKAKLVYHRELTKYLTKGAIE